MSGSSGFGSVRLDPGGLRRLGLFVFTFSPDPSERGGRGRLDCPVSLPGS